ncbi:hypothetical protein T05_8109 [Trichinella murrelli]|uniref:Uncharacterized protein n=1 Tax=Trichinella murrelli TaxID=144512 RepID=A0A0V0SXE2_9BILA|nr:hypothetical protein T05_8109 [Trichinella murrelli]
MLRLGKNSSSGALVRLTYVASGSVVKRSLSLFTAFRNH